jgi:hypothetical protein
MRGETPLVAKARADRGTIHNVPVLMLVAAVVILAGVVVVASGRGGEIAPEYPDYPPIDLGPVTAADVALLRPPSAAWGYNMRVTDEALEIIASAVTERDIKIAELQQQLDDLRGEPPQRERRPSGAWPAVADAGYEEAKEAKGAEGAGPAGSEWPFADRSALSADPETTRPEAFTARPGDGSPETTRPEAFTVRPGDGSSEGTGEKPGDQDTTYGTGQPAAWGRPASAPVWSGAGRDDLPHNTGEPTNPDLPQQSPVWAAAGQQHEGGPQQAGDGEGWAPAPGPAPAGSSSGPAEASWPGPPWGKVTSPWDEPDDAGAEPFVWDDSHQTLVWGAEHQRAKASRLQEQDEASEPGQDEPETGQYAAQPDQATAEPGQATAEPGQATAEPGQATAEPGQDGPETGQATAEPGQDGPETGQATAEPGQATAEPGQDGPETGQATAEPGQATAEPGQDGPETGQATAEPGQATAEPGQDAADSDGERSLAHSEQDRG